MGQGAGHQEFAGLDMSAHPGGVSTYSCAWHHLLTIFVVGGVITCAARWKESISRERHFLLGWHRLPQGFYSRASSSPPPARRARFIALTDLQRL